MSKKKMEKGSLCVTCQKPATKWLKTSGMFEESSCGEEECMNEAIIRDQALLHEPRQTIELDCPPGSPRPGDLIEKVIEETGLELKETSGRFMGNWSWKYDDVDPEKWEEIKPILKRRIERLYRKGIIRYGSW